jgi:hypothetical protein
MGGPSAIGYRFRESYVRSLDPGLSIFRCHLNRSPGLAHICSACRAGSSSMLLTGFNQRTYWPLIYVNLKQVSHDSYLFDIIFLVRIGFSDQAEFTLRRSMKTNFVPTSPYG